MDKQKIERIYNYLHHGTEVLPEAERIEAQKVINAFVINRDGNHYLVVSDDGFKCVEYSFICDWYNENAGKELVEEALHESDTMEGLYTYAAVEALNSVGYDLDKIIDILQ